MPGSVKTKIRWGTIFLFSLLILSGGFSIFYLEKTRTQSRNILKANYESLEYSHTMQLALDSIFQRNTAFIDSFEKVLLLQESNITEKGEAEVTRQLRNNFNQLKNGDSIAHHRLQTNIREIIALNMEAIRVKNQKAEAGAEEALTYLITIVSIIFIIALTFVYNFPSILINPIRKLTDAINAIGQKDYKHRIHIDSKDEFGKLASAFNEMAERLEYFESSNLNKLIFEKKRAEAVINSLKDASIGIDSNDTVLFANNQALQLLGLTAKDVIGINTPEIASRNDLFRFLIDQKGSAPFKIVVDGRENYFIKEVMEVSQEGSSNKVIVLKNITSFKELDVAKTNFIATVSHELKTPLASSDFSLKLMEDERIGKLSSEQKELIQNLKADNQRMLRILSELLNMSQVESGKIQLNIIKADVFKIIESSLAAVSASAKEKDIIIEQEIAADIATINADAEKLVWVLNNFLTNAIKFSPSPDSIKISIRQNENSVSFAVKDNGPGIEEKYLNRIFDRYFQVPGRSDKKGSGIGLAICKDFIEAMGGKIWVKSQYGEGSTFGFDLPI
jgi:NtrC-family two-component system sensor histidine kinase KinB